MQVLPPLRLEAWLESRSEDGAGARWVGDAEGSAVPRDAPAQGEPWLGLVGPSPGFDERERRAIGARGFQPIRLADRRLRTETAAVAMAAVRAAFGGGTAG
jgi:RsmE family RNA methyltransferase